MCIHTHTKKKVWSPVPPPSPNNPSFLSLTTLFCRAIWYLKCIFLPHLDRDERRLWGVLVPIDLAPNWNEEKWDQRLQSPAGTSWELVAGPLVISLCLDPWSSPPEGVLVFFLHCMLKTRSTLANISWEMKEKARAIIHTLGHLPHCNNNISLLAHAQPPFFQAKKNDQSRYSTNKSNISFPNC